MKTSLLLFGALVLSALACEKSQLAEYGQAQTSVIAAFQADKTPSKQPSPPAPAKKSAPQKERAPRPAPPAHLFM